MKVCIVGNGLISLTLAKALVNKGVFVDLVSNGKFNKIDKSRTLGISKNNISYFNKNILNIKKLLWGINKIEIYSENLSNEKILNFEDKKEHLFSMIKNHELYEYLISSLKKNKLFKKKKGYRKSLTKNYKLIVNCDENNLMSKKYFNKKFSKNYYSYAHTTIINHKKISNKTATQIFTKKGPFAFLPISDTETSIVYSARGSNNLDLEKLIKFYNFKYLDLKINKISNFELKSKNLRNYYFKNVLAFGDMLHRIHPLAGQGFNMSIRDVKLLMELIQYRLNLGLELDLSICKDFQERIKHKNFFFSNSIDFIYEFFNFESKIDNSFLAKSVQSLGKNKSLNKFFTRFADIGIGT